MIRTWLKEFRYNQTLGVLREGIRFRQLRYATMAVQRRPLAHLPVWSVALLHISITCCSLFTVVQLIVYSSSVHCLQLFSSLFTAVQPCEVPSKVVEKYFGDISPPISKGRWQISVECGKDGTEDDVFLVVYGVKGHSTPHHINSKEKLTPGALIISDVSTNFSCKYEIKISELHVPVHH